MERKKSKELIWFAYFFLRSMLLSLIRFKKYKLIFLILFLLLGLVVQNSCICAEEEFILVPEESNLAEDGYSANNDLDAEYAVHGKSKKKKMINKKQFLASDSLNSLEKTVTLKDLVFKTAYIVLILLGILLILKMYLSRYKFGEAGSVFDNFAQKLSNAISNPQGLKLKQALILTPGQNLYIVEVEGRKFLLGGTHQGGVQFLADLTDKQNTHSLSFREIEDFQKKIILNEPKTQTHHIKKVAHEEIKNLDLMETLETPFLESNNRELLEVDTNQAKEHNSLNIRQSFKRKPNFRKTLLSKV